MRHTCDPRHESMRGAPKQLICTHSACSIKCMPRPASATVGRALREPPNSRHATACLIISPPKICGAMRANRLATASGRAANSRNSCSSSCLPQPRPTALVSARTCPARRCLLLVSRSCCSKRCRPNGWSAHQRRPAALQSSAPLLYPSYAPLHKTLLMQGTVLWWRRSVVGPSSARHVSQAQAPGPQAPGSTVISSCLIHTLGRIGRAREVGRAVRALSLLLHPDHAQVGHAQGHRAGVLAGPFLLCRLRNPGARGASGWCSMSLL